MCQIRGRALFVIKPFIQSQGTWTWEILRHYTCPPRTAISKKQKHEVQREAAAPREKLRFNFLSVRKYEVFVFLSSRLIACLFGLFVCFLCFLFSFFLRVLCLLACPLSFGPLAFGVPCSTLSRMGPPRAALPTALLLACLFCSSPLTLDWAQTQYVPRIEKRPRPQHAVYI